MEITFKNLAGVMLRTVVTAVVYTTVSTTVSRFLNKNNNKQKDSKPTQDVVVNSCCRN